MVLKEKKCHFLIFHFHVAHNILCYPPILPKHSIFGMTKEKLVETFGGQTRCSITVGSVKVGILDCRGGGNLLVVSSKASKGIIAFCLEEF